MTTPPFESVYDAFEIEMLRDAYEAITECDMWEWLRVYSPEEGKGFMFGNHPNQEKINKAMKFDGHSGASYGWTMRAMEDIAKSGWENHKNRVREARSTRKLTQWAATQTRKPAGNPCPCRHAQGFTDGWCGVAGGGVPGCDH